MRTFNLKDMAVKADEVQDNDREEFIVPEEGAEYEATIVHAQWKEKNGLPSWWIILSTKDGPFPLNLGLSKEYDFINKRTFDNLRAVGITNFDNLDAEVVNEILKGSRVNVKVKWGKNKNGGDPFANHVLSAVEENIPEPEDF